MKCYHQASTDTGSVVLEMLQSLMPNIVENYQKMSPVGSTSRAQLALNDLKTLPKTIETTDQLMVGDNTWVLKTSPNLFVPTQKQIHGRLRSKLADLLK